MQEELKELQPELKETKIETEKLLKEIEKETAEVEKIKKVMLILVCLYPYLSSTFSLWVCNVFRGVQVKSDFVFLCI